MNVTIRTVARRRAVCMAHLGRYPMIGETFAKLSEWKKGHPGEYGQSLALFYDDPNSTPVDQLRSDAGIFIPDSFELSDSELHVLDIDEGLFAITTYQGSYAGLPAAWEAFKNAELPRGLHSRSAPSFEIYVTMGETGDGSDAVTELYRPLTQVEPQEI